MAGTHSHPHKPYTEIHCQDLSTQCPKFTPKPTNEPTNAPTTTPTPEPTPGPTRPLVPSTPVDIDPDVCSWANMTLFVLVDASESIAGTNWDLSKQWIVDVFDDANKVIKDQEKEWKKQGYDITLCMRTSLIIFSSVVNVVWDLNAHGSCYDTISGKNQIMNLERPHDPLDTIHGTHTKDALQKALDITRAQRREDERTMVLLLTDGLPQSVEGDESQNPCFFPPNALTRGYGSDKRFDGQNIALKIVAVGDIFNRQSFLCFPTQEVIQVGEIIDVPEYTTDVNNEFFAEFCQVLTYGCDIPLYPHYPNNAQPLYNTSISDLILDVDNNGFLYTFRVRDKYTTKDRSVNIWPTIASIKAESNCTRDNITLSAKLWKWINETHLDPNPFVSNNKEQVQHYAIDRDGDTYNWYNFSIPSNRNSTLSQGHYYTLEIIVEDYGRCRYDDLRFQVQSPFIGPGTIYRTQYFDDVWLLFRDKKDIQNDEWFPNLINSPDQPDYFDEEFPFVTFCIKESAVPATPTPTESPTVAPTGLISQFLYNLQGKCKEN